MKRTTLWMIVGIYYLSQILGILAFSFDYKDGKAKTKLYITLYCGIMSSLMFGAIPTMFQVARTATYVNGPNLHYKISALMCYIRIAAVLITVFLNWNNRKNFIKTFNDFQHFRWQFLKKIPASAKVEKHFENSVRSKFYWTVIANILLFLGSHDMLRNIFSVTSPAILMGMCFLVTVLNIIMTHYYFAIINVNVLLATINEEVKRILNSSAELFKHQRLKQIKPGAFITQCCQLADDLDYLAMAQYNLLQLADRINKMYSIQGTCVLMTIYMNNISVMYMTYMVFQHESIFQVYGKWIFLAIPSLTFLYYMDLKIYVMSMFDLIDFFKNPGTLLKNHRSWLPTLDVRLEKSLRNFSLQVASFPLDTTFLGLYEFNRAMVFAVFSSTISNAIVLMQNDYQHNVDM